MRARLRKLLHDLSETFWLIPFALVTLGAVGAVLLVGLDRDGVVPRGLIQSAWLYNGGGTGARTLLGAVASSTIGVAGTVFSITIAALSLAAGQMGPRLLRNFTRDRGNQVTLGVFLGTFAYALMVLRSVRSHDEGDFVPHLALSVGLLLALVSVATLVFFVGHMAGRINVDTVIDLVSQDVHDALHRLTPDDPPPDPPPVAFWQDAVPVTDGRRGYLQQLDDEGLADWAAEHGVAIRLLARAGDYIFPGAPIAAITPAAEGAAITPAPEGAAITPAAAGAAAAVRDATALGRQRISAADLEASVRQLVEVAVRALSPGINDPHTAISVLDQLGAVLCELAPLYLPNGVTVRDGRVVLVVRPITYDGLTDAMFHLIRQNGARSVAVLIRLLEVLTAVLTCERNPSRVQTLQRHADLVLADAETTLTNRGDLTDIRRRYEAFRRMRLHPPLGGVPIDTVRR